MNLWRFLAEVCSRRPMSAHELHTPRSLRPAILGVLLLICGGALCMGAAWTAGIIPGAWVALVGGVILVLAGVVLVAGGLLASGRAGRRSIGEDGADIDLFGDASADTQPDLKDLPRHPKRYSVAEAVEAAPPDEAPPGQPVRIRCPDCNGVVDLPARRCVYCGADLRGLSPPVPRRRPFVSFRDWLRRRRARRRRKPSSRR